MRGGHGDDLSAVGRIGQDFLVAAERGVEHHFPAAHLAGPARRRRRDGAEVPALKNAARRQRQKRFSLFYFSHGKSLSNTSVSSRLFPSDTKAQLAPTAFSSSRT